MGAFPPKLAATRRDGFLSPSLPRWKGRACDHQVPALLVSLSSVWIAARNERGCKRKAAPLRSRKVNSCYTAPNAATVLLVPQGARRRPTAFQDVLKSTGESHAGWQVEVVMTSVKTVTIVAVLLAAGTSLAMAQNGPCCASPSDAWGPENGDPVSPSA